MFRHFVSLLALAAIAAGPAWASADAGPSLTGEAALKRLMEGNRRFVTDHPVRASATSHHRTALARHQKPVAVIVGCADSRVPPELLFDQGLGELFVIRVAGHVINDAVLGSIEYAVEHLGSPLVVVLGHERCGAVTASLGDGHAPGHIPALTSPIKPAVAISRHTLGDPLDQAVMSNVVLGVTQLRVSQPMLADRVKANKLLIVGARYDLDTGEVHILPERLRLEPLAADWSSLQAQE